VTLIARVLALLLVGKALVERLRAGAKANASVGGQVMSPSRSMAATRVQKADAEPEGPIPPQRKGEPGPDTPLDLGPRDWKATITRAIKEIKDDRVPFAAAGMAFLLLSCRGTGLHRLGRDHGNLEG
jgi:hypothetical protein